MPNWVYEQTFQGDANVRIESMDVHIKTNRIFWTNWHTSSISSYELPSSTSGPSSNSHRHRREGTVSNLQVGTPGGGGGRARAAAGASVRLWLQAQKRPQ